MKYLFFLTDFNETEFSQEIFEKSPDIKFQENLQWELSSSTWTNGQTDMMKLMLFAILQTGPKMDATET